MIAIDTETELLEPGCLAPRLVCSQIATSERAQIFGRVSSSAIVASYLADPSELIVGHNIAFDFGVLGMHDQSLIPLIFAAYRAGRVRDTMVREKLIAIREGRSLESGFSLGDLAQKYLGHVLDKGADSWRYRYGELMHTPIDQWPDPAKGYALTDATSTLAVFHAQQNLIDPSVDSVSPDEILQTRAAWVLHLMGLWGFRTDAGMVADLKSRLEEECSEAEKRLLATGIYKIAGTKKSPELSKDMDTIKKRIAKSYETRSLPLPVTEKGNLQTTEEILRETEDPDLLILADSNYSQKLLSTFIPLVESGTKHPVTPRWNVLVSSGRTSCGSKDAVGNWQNPPKKGGIRECVIPRPGYLFVGADYAQIELCTLAQTTLDWFGKSEMAEALQAGRDLHLDLCVSTPVLLAPMSYDEAIALKKAGDDRVNVKRQFAKVINFGFPGGMGATTFVAHAKKNGVEIDEQTAWAVKNAWLAKWSEMPAYFQRIAAMVDAKAPIVQNRSGRVRGGCDFTSAANTFFQGGASDGAKEALWQVAWKCYQDERSALFGSRIVLFLHDEIILETPQDRASEAGDALVKVMVASMRKYTPDIPIKAEPRITRRWYKKAGEVRDAQGKLQLWEQNEGGR